MAMATVDPRMMDLVWTDRSTYEAVYFKRPEIVRIPVEVRTSAEVSSPVVASTPQLGLVAELEAIRGSIRASLQPAVPTGPTTQDSLLARAAHLESSNQSLRTLVEKLTQSIEKLETKVQSGGLPKPATSAKPVKKEDSDDDDFAFSDSDEEEAPKESNVEKMKRLAAEKKAAKEAAEAAKGHVGPITKSNVVMDVKPWDDETDLKELEKAMRSIEMEGLTWGDSKLIEMAFGIKKLRISTCVVDHLVGLYDLEDKMTAFEDFVQSVDTVSHNKI